MMFSDKDMFFVKTGIIRVVMVTALILLLPLIAMQFTSEVNWDIADFVIMGALCLILGTLLVFTLRIIPRRRVQVIVIFAVIFVYIWTELAVGIFTNLGS